MRAVGFNWKGKHKNNRHTTENKREKKTESFVKK